MFSGCYTALITPMNSQGLDVESLRKLVEFQVSCDVSGILAVGTTGESPTLDWTEHDMVIEKVHEFADGKCITIGGTGSNSTAETIRGTEHAVKSGVEAVLLVDPYYNGPSSLEIRREYVEVIAKAFPDTSVIPYVIPGRTGTKLLPEDLATAYKNYPNVCAVKEATEDFDNMRRTRECCGEDFVILSGDDGKTLDMMIDPAIKAAGVISVASNIAPAAVQKMTENLAKGEIEEGKKMAQALEPLFGIVTVKTEEETPYGTVICKARNPLGTKTLMNIIGMPSGPCRQPLGKMTEKGIQVVVDAAKKVYKNNPEILKPVEDFFGVNLEERLNDKKFCQELYYED
ncbi:4-hydroxy-tetrahydrodipicolinate synthase [Candidatus Poribacteria bacterium]|nr:4-hydroxy-tetrahydrodipicolinate synthase [Candidatus Poribacteria bacterium]